MRSDVVWAKGFTGPWIDAKWLIEIGRGEAREWLELLDKPKFKFNVKPIHNK